MRANSSNTRCWYCISVPNFAAWNRRSPFQSSRASALPVWKRAPGSLATVEEAQVALEREEGLLDLINQPVVLGMEDRVHTGEADVLVHAAVAGDVVRVEQLVVVGEILTG